MRSEKTGLRSRLKRLRVTVDQVIAQVVTSVLSGRSAAIRGPKAAVVLLVTAGAGSVGDEAMLVALAASLRNRGCRRIAALVLPGATGWSSFALADEIRQAPTASPRSWVAFCRWLAGFDAFGLIGADTLDGYYAPNRTKSRLLLAEVAARLGLRSVLLGFSFRSDPAATVIPALRRAGGRATVLCRDPVSAKRVRAQAGLAVIEVADAAFMLEPDGSTDRVRAAVQWIRSRRHAGGRIIGVNCNVQAIERPDRMTPESLTTAYAEAISAVATRHSEVSFILVPHDARGAHSDERMAHQIDLRVDPTFRSRVLLVEQAWTAAEIKALAGELNAAISGRMHFAIACLGSGIPVAAFEYQDKFSGLYSLFGLDGLCVPGAGSLDTGVVQGLLERLLAEEAALRTQIATRLPTVVEMANLNTLALLGELP